MARQRTHRLAAVAMLALAALSMASLGGIPFLAGCAQQKTQETVGVRTVLEFEDEVVTEAFDGVDTLPEAEQENAAAKVAAFSTAVQSGDRLAITADAWPRWPEVRSLAEAGIEAKRKAGAIGTGVAASKLEHLNQFGRILARTVGVPP